jgi:hypothetical protein
LNQGEIITMSNRLLNITITGNPKSPTMKDLPRSFFADPKDMDFLQRFLRFHAERAHVRKLQIVDERHRLAIPASLVLGCDEYSRIKHQQSSPRVLNAFVRSPNSVSRLGDDDDRSEPAGIKTRGVQRGR